MFFFGCCRWQVSERKSLAVSIDGITSRMGLDGNVVRREFNFALIRLKQVSLRRRAKGSLSRLATRSYSLFWRLSHATYNSIPVMCPSLLRWQVTNQLHDICNIHDLQRQHWQNMTKPLNSAQYSKFHEIRTDHVDSNNKPSTTQQQDLEACMLVSGGIRTSIFTSRRGHMPPSQGSKFPFQSGVHWLPLENPWWSTGLVASTGFDDFQEETW